ncbi:MAG: alkylhydroperoxidase family enzyme [Gammaproteobacteria bacterium]|jgi:alkylhydroperoxidase family enzyme
MIAISNDTDPFENHGLFSDTEMAALAWADSVTLISGESEMETKLAVLMEHYSEAEAVDLAVIFSLMNCLDRIAISFGDKPAKREGAD